MDDLRWLLGLLLLSISGVGMAAEPVRYTSAFDIKYMYCEVKTNGLVGLRNLRSALNGLGFGTSSVMATLNLENGDNEISVATGALNWYNPEITDPKEKATYHPDAYCNVQFMTKREGKYHTLAELSVTVGQDGLPVSGDKTVVRTKQPGYQLTPGYVDKDFYREELYPLGMELYEFTKTVQVSGLPEWGWVNAEPYTDTPEQRVLLELAYLDLWQAFATKNLPIIQERFSVAMQAWAYAADETPQAIFEDLSFLQKMQQKDFKMVAINWQAYEPLVMNKGRLVRLINKSKPTYSPLTYTYGDSLAYYAPTFALVDGKFVVVL